MLPISAFKCSNLHLRLVVGKSVGKLSESAAITEMVIKRDETHLPALLNYADLAGRMGRGEDSVSLLLRCVVQDQSNKEAQSLLGREVGRSDGVAHVLANLPISPSTAPAYAFLATTLRDVGQTNRSLDLLKLAAGAKPGSAAYALNCFHAFELVGDLEGGFRFVKGFLKGLKGESKVSVATSTKRPTDNTQLTARRPSSLGRCTT